jgi:hypothetical protein
MGKVYRGRNSLMGELVGVVENNKVYRGRNSLMGELVGVVEDGVTSGAAALLLLL